MLAKATPSSRAGTKLPTQWQASHRLRQEMLSTLLRNSYETPRMMRANSSIMSAVYSPLNMVA